MKYYAFNKFNTMVKKGKYYFDDLTPIYCIGILSENIYNFEDYYNYGLLKNQYNDVMDKQITYVTIELDKFKLTESEVKNDLEKLIFTMKNLPKYATTIKQPDFFTEEWLDSAIKELDIRNFTPEQYEQYSNMLARTGTIVYAGKLEIEKAVKESKSEAVIGLYENGVSVPIIAKSLKMKEEQVRQIIKEHQKTIH